MTVYTFEINAFANLPSLEQALSQIRSALETGSAQLRSALSITPTVNPEAFEKLTADLNATGEKAVAQAVKAGEEIGQALSQKIPISNDLGSRLNTVLRDALAEMRAQIEQFSATTHILGDDRAVLSEFAGEFQSTMLRSIQVVAADLRKELNLAARSAQLDPRAVTGQFKGSQIAAASSRQLTPVVNDMEAERQRLEASRTGGAGSPAAVANRLVTAVDIILQEALDAVEAGRALTSAQAAKLREIGLAQDFRRPGSTGPISPTAPLVVDTGAGQPAVFRPQKDGTFAPYSEEETLQFNRDLENASAQLQRTTAADEVKQVATQNLARLLADPEAKRVGSGQTAPFRSGQGEFFTSTGTPIEEQARINQLQLQYIRQLETRNSEQSAANSVATTQRSPGGAFLGGATGRGFDAHAAFDPQAAVGNLLGTAGVLLRYGAIGAGLAGAFSGLHELKTQVVDYQSSLANLDEVMGATKSGQIDLTSAFAAAAPAGIGAADAVDLGAEALARYRSEIEAGASANDIFQTSLLNIGQASVLTGVDAKTVGEQLIDATQGFKVGSTGQSRILDAVENARKNFGGDRAQIIQAIGDAGDLASQAGIDPEELSNIVALIQSRTGATGSTVASAFERTVSRQGTGQFQQALGALGIQDTGDLVSEITQLSTAYQHLNKTQQDTLVAQLGGARQARELLPLLEEGTGLVDANARSYAGAGAAAQQYERQQATLAGELRQISGELKDFAAALAQSGAFDALGLIAEGFKDVLGGVDELLAAFDGVPRIFRDAAFGAFELLLVLRLIGNEQEKIAIGNAVAKVPVLGSFASRIGLGTRAAAETPEATGAEALANAGNVAAERLIAGADAAAERLAAGGAAAGEANAIGGIGAAEAGAASRVGAVNFIGDSPEVAGVVAPAEAAAVVAPSEGAAIGAAFAGGASREAAGLPALKGISGFAGGVGVAGEGAAAGGAAALGLLTNPITLAIGGLIAIGGVTNSMHRLSAASAQGSLALESLNNANTPQTLTTAEDALRSARQQVAHDSGGPFGSIAGFFTGAHGKEATFEANAEYAHNLASRIAGETGNTATLSQNVFGPSGSDIVTGLKTMAQEGVSASTQLHAVAKALGVVGAQAGDAKSLLGGTEKGSLNSVLGLRNVGQLNAGLVSDPASYAREIPSLATDGHLRRFAGQSNVDTLDVPDAAKLSAAVDAALKNRPDGALLTDADKQKIATNIAETFGVTGSDTDKIRADIRAGVLQRLSTLSHRSQTTGTAPITDDALKTILGGEDGNSGLLSVISSFQPDAFDPTGGADQLRNAIGILKNFASRADRSGPEYAVLIAALHQEEDKYAQARISDIERLRAAADARTSPANYAEIDQGYFDREITAAGADTNQIIGVIDNMTHAQIKLVEQMLRHQVQLARAADDAATELAAHIPSAERSGVLGSADDNLNTALDNLQAFIEGKRRSTTADGTNSGPNATQQARLAQIESQAQSGNDVQNAQIALQAANYQFKIAHKGTADYYSAVKAVADAKYQLSQAEEQAASAAVAANVYPGSALSSARASIIEAKDAVTAAIPGTAAFFQAEQQLKQAQIDYGNALIQYHATERSLNTDDTDPVVQARNTLATARAQLRVDQRRGAPKDVIATDALAVKDDTQARQAAGFQQRLSDVQTLHNLQRLSDQAYLNYLGHEHDRLEAIKHKTRQQTDELNSIDLAIKSANEQMQGQFNIGDIHVPTPYEAKRYVESQMQGENYATARISHTHNNQRNTVINNHNHQRFDFRGLDKREVQEILREALGGEATHRSGVATRKGM
jgi:hypothetical protein